MGLKMNTINQSYALFMDNLSSHRTKNVIYQITQL